MSGDPNDPAIGPTLAELALAARNDPNNPAYVNPSSPYAQNTPQQQALVNAQINAPPTPGSAVLGNPAVSAPPNRALLGGGIDAKVGANLGPGDIAALNSGTSGYGTREQKPLATTGVKAGGVPGATQVSPERELYEGSNNLGDKRKSLLDQEAGINEQNKRLTDIGLESATKAQGLREANFQLDEMKNDLVKYQIEQHDKENKRQLDQEAADVRAQKVDPQHWFKERGVAGSILAAISMGAGAFGAAFSKNGTNYAMDIINNSIDKDMQSQKENINNQWKALDFHGSQNDKEYTKGQFTLNSLQNEKYKAYDHASAMINDIKQRTNDQVAVNNLDKLGLAIEGKKTDIDQDRLQRKFGVAKYEQAQAAAAANADPYNAHNLEKDWKAYVTEAAKEQAKNPKAPGALPKEEWLKLRTSGGSGVGGGAKLGDKEQEAVNSIDEFTKTANRAQEILKDTTYANSPKGRAELDQIQRNLVLAYPKTQTGSTRINEAELKKGDESFKGLGGVIRSDMLGTTGVTLEVLKEQAKDRKKRIQGGKGTTVSSDEGVPGATLAGE